MPQDFKIDAKRGNTNPNDFPSMVLTGRLGGTLTSAEEENLTASAVIADGLPLSLRADGKIEKVESVATSEGRQGYAEATPLTYLGGGQGAMRSANLCYDTNSNKTVLVYRRQSGGGYPYPGTGGLMIGTSSGASISWTSNIAFESSNCGNVQAVFDSGSNKIIICYVLESDGKLYSKVGTVSGNTISFGSRVVVDSGSFSTRIALVYSSVDNKTVVMYEDDTTWGQEYGGSRVGTLSGTTMSWGSNVEWAGDELSQITASYSPTSNKIVVSYYDYEYYQSALRNSVRIGTISGTSISWGSVVRVSTMQWSYSEASVAESVDKIIMNHSSYTDGGSNTYKGRCRIGTISGTTTTWGTDVIYNSSKTHLYGNSWTQWAGPPYNRIVLIWRAPDTYYSEFIIGEISGTSTTWGTKDNLGMGMSTHYAIGFDPVSNLVHALNAFDSTWTYIAFVGFAGTSTNLGDFKGLAAEAFTAEETGTITLPGGVNSRQSGLTPNANYWLANDGSLSATDTGNAMIGYAISDTEIKLDGGTAHDEDTTILYVGDDGSVFYAQVEVEPSDNLLDLSLYQKPSTSTATDNTYRAHGNWKVKGFTGANTINTGLRDFAPTDIMRNYRNNYLVMQSGTTAGGGNSAQHTNISVTAGTKYAFKARIYANSGIVTVLEVQAINIDKSGGEGVTNPSGLDGTYTDSVSGDTVIVSSSGTTVTRYFRIPPYTTIDIFWLLQADATVSDAEIVITAQKPSSNSGPNAQNWGYGTNFMISDISFSPAKIVNLYDSLLGDPAEARGTPLYSDGTKAYWNYPRENPVGLDTSATYLNRSIYTHGYIAGGYKGSNPWRSLNKTWHSTDVTHYCGEQLDASLNFNDGTFSDFNGYCHGTTNTYQGASNRTSSYNLHTGIRRQTTGAQTYGSSGLTFPYTGQNPTAEGLTYGTAASPQHVGGWALPMSVTLGACFTAIENQIGYIFGNGQTMGKFHFPTEVMYSGTGPVSYTSNWSGSEGENYGFTSAGGTRHRMAFSNDTFSSVSASWSPDGLIKQLASKHGKNYSGSGTNHSQGAVRFNNDTGSDIASYNKVYSSGQENYEMGQNHGYMLGSYNAQENNLTTKMIYATDTETAMGFSTQPKGHFGMASGSCSSAAATVAMNHPT